jgi:hypothetical protein
MSSSLPSASNDYLPPSGMVLGPDAWIASITHLAARVRELEAQQTDVDAVLALSQGTAQAAIASAAEPLAAQFQAALAVLLAQITAAEDQLAALESAGVDPANIAIPPSVGLGTGLNLNTALAALKAYADDVNATLAAAVATKLAIADEASDSDIDGTGATGNGKWVDAPGARRAAGNIFAIGDRVTSARVTAAQQGTWLPCDGKSYTIAAYPTLAGLLGQRHANLVLSSGATQPGFNNIMKIAFGNGVFVAYENGVANVLVSATGASWASYAHGLSTALWFVGFANGQFVALAAGTSTVTRVSANGQTWADPNSGIAMSGSMTSFADLVYSGSTYIAVPTGGMNIYRSTNLKAWSAVALPYTQGGSPSAQCIAAGNGLTMVGTTDGLFVSATDGASWTEVVGLGNITNIAFVDGAFVLFTTISSGLVILRTVDGSTFTETTHPLVRAVASVSARTLAVGMNGKLAIPVSGGPNRLLESVDGGRTWRHGPRIASPPFSFAGGTDRFIGLRYYTDAASILAADTAATEFRVPGGTHHLDQFVRAA